VNGGLTEQISPSRGLRQGDPLSPYLFLLCAEGFSGLINDAEARGIIQGVTICARAPSITHLLFADDSLLLLKANEENAAPKIDRNLCKLWSSHRNLGMKNI